MGVPPSMNVGVKLQVGHVKCHRARHVGTEDQLAKTNGVSGANVQASHDGIVADWSSPRRAAYHQSASNKSRADAAVFTTPDVAGASVVLLDVSETVRPSYCR